MRPLWPIERAALEAAAQDDAAIADNLILQIQAASVINFENSGAGFFSTISVMGEVPALPESSPLKAGAVGSADGAHDFAVSIQPRQSPGHAYRARPVGHNARCCGKSGGVCVCIEGHMIGHRKRIAGKFLSLEIEGLSQQGRLPLEEQEA